MRRGDNLSSAARDNGVTIRTIKRYAGSALVQDRRGDAFAQRRATDSSDTSKFPVMRARATKPRGSKPASEFAKYKAAINRLLRGDRDAMAPWHGREIAGIELITDTKTLIDQARKEILPYSLYRALSGGAA